jgi:hypothetical protein
MSPPKIKTAERVAIQLASASSAIPASVQQSTQRLCDDQQTAARRFPLIVDAVARLRSRSCIIDGEAVACDDNGVASFDLIRHHRANQVVFLYAFDLIELNGDDLRHDPLEGRKETLAMILAKAGPGIRFNEHMVLSWPTRAYRYAGSCNQSDRRLRARIRSTRVGFPPIGPRRRRRPF